MYQPQVPMMKLLEIVQSPTGQLMRRIRYFTQYRAQYVGA
jgi:hypothetical protein